MYRPKNKLLSNRRRREKNKEKRRKEERERNEEERERRNMDKDKKKVWSQKLVLAITGEFNSKSNEI
jgi:hypothetical protein